MGKTTSEDANEVKRHIFRVLENDVINAEDNLSRSKMALGRYRLYPQPQLAPSQEEVVREYEDYRDRARKALELVRATFGWRP